MLTKTEENERKKEWKRKLMLILVPISRFVTKSRLFAFPSLLLLQSSSMEVWEGLKLFYEPSISHEPDSLFILKPKRSSNRSIMAWISKKTEANGGGGRPPRSWQPPRPGHGCHHGPWWSPWLNRGGHWPSRPVLPGTTRFVLFVFIRGLLVLGYLLWAFWACLLPP